MSVLSNFNIANEMSFELRGPYSTLWESMAKSGNQRVNSHILLRPTDQISICLKSSKSIYIMTSVNSLKAKTWSIDLLNEQVVGH